MTPNAVAAGLCVSVVFAPVDFSKTGLSMCCAGLPHGLMDRIEMTQNSATGVYFSPLPWHVDRTAYLLNKLNTASTAAAKTYDSVALMQAIRDRLGACLAHVGTRVLGIDGDSDHLWTADLHQMAARLKAPIEPLSAAIERLKSNNNTLDEIAAARATKRVVASWEEAMQAMQAPWNSRCTPESAAASLNALVQMEHWLLAASGSKLRSTRTFRPSPHHA